jgi:hypothetical protein
MGDVTSRQDDLGRNTVRNIPGHTIYKVADAENESWKRTLNTLIEEWTKTTPNGAAILAAYRRNCSTSAPGSEKSNHQSRGTR